MSDIYCYTNSQSLNKPAESTLGLTFFYSGIEECAPNHYWLGIRDHYIIHFILKGHGKCTFSDDTFELSKGQAFLVIPGQKVHYCANEKDPWKYCWIAFSGVQAKTLISFSDFSNKKSVAGFNNINEVENTIVKLESIMPNQANKDTLSLSYLLFLISCLDAKKQEHDNRHGIQGHHLDIAISFIDRNYSRRIKVEHVAKHVGVARKYLGEIFKKYFNISTQQYLLNKRMNQAVILLGNSTLSIKEIAHSVGYCDALLFSKMFKNKYGISPKSFRERM